MAIDPIGNTPQTLANVSTTASATDGSSRLQQKQLGQDEFFKLLTTQLASQDPLEPMEDTAFIAQMASFSQLEMTSEMTKSFDNFSKSQQFVASQNYIGKMVSFPGEAPGLVTAVEFIDDEAFVFTDGRNDNRRSVDSINKVELPPQQLVTSSRLLPEEG